MNNFEIVKISEFLTERTGTYKPGDPNLLGLKRLEKIDFDGKIYQSEKPSRTNMIVVYPGDLVISGINVHKGAIAVYEGRDPIIATIHYSSYIFDDQKIDIKYFKRFLKSPEFLRLLKEQVKDGIKTEIKPKKFLPIQIKLPDLSIQYKINKYFNSLEKELRELKSELNHQKSYLSQLKQAILQEAVSGKLTEEWRKENPMEKGNPDADAAALLAKIKTEKQQLIAEGKLKKQKNIPPISADEIPFSLPDSWIWCQIDSLVFSLRHDLRTGPFGSSLHKYDHRLEGVPVLGIESIDKNGKFTGRNKIFVDMEKAKELSSFSVKGGDIVNSNNNETSRSTIVTNNLIQRCSSRCIHSVPF